MSYDGQDDIDDFDESPRPAKRPRTTKAGGQTKAAPGAAKKKPKLFKESSKSTEYVQDSDSDEPVKPARKPVAKPTNKARSVTPSSISGRGKGNRNARTRQRAESSGSEDAFEPTKPPKTIPRAIRMVDSDSGDKPKAKKPKHRVHEPIDLDRFLPKFVSQAPPPESSDPANLRGEIWIKPPPVVRQPPMEPPPIPKQHTISEAASKPKPQSILKPPAPIPKMPPTSVIRPGTSQCFTITPASRPLNNPAQAPMTPGISNGQVDGRSFDRPLSTSFTPHSPGKNQKPMTTFTGLNADARPKSMPFVVEEEDNDDGDEVTPNSLARPSDPATTLTHSSLQKPGRPRDIAAVTNGKENVPSALQRLCNKTAVSLSSQNNLSTTTISSHKPRAPQTVMQNRIPLPTTSKTLTSVSSAPVDVEVLDELADLPSDAFSSSPEKESSVMARPSQQPVRTTGLGGLSTGKRQMTLHGSFSAPADNEQSKASKTAWPLADKQEKPTHHKLETDATSTWVYPTNLGTIRDYQYNIVNMGLYHNLLVALPTGLGKTFIAATIMLNWFRWTKDAQIVFVAPTKPLVAQQVEACFHTVGIPRSCTAMLTGTISPALRAEAWEHKRVFFMTPQTMGNDLRSGICDPKRIVLLVVDEAHRATGNYSYVDIVAFLRRFNTSFRILALTATPGSKIETVQQVIDGLSISRVEIRTEASLDIRQYVHARETETFLFDYSDEQNMIMDLFSKAIKPVLDKLNGQNAYWLKDPMKLTAFGLTQAQRQWNTSEAGRKASWPIKSMVQTTFKVLASLAHAVSMLKFHGIGPFFRKVAAFKRDCDDGETKTMKVATQIRTNENFIKMFNYVQGWVNNPDFIGHPKLEYLREVILNHFLDAGEAERIADAQSTTRVMVFAQFRDSAEQIARVLKRNDPMIRPHVFVGQAAAEGSAGMDQKLQLDVIEKFKAGTFNTLVATSIGEEGLDIGEVDLIICYDANASPIRMLQRMGRTGRKRRGKIVLLLMRDKEERDFAAAKDNYEKMQGMIASGKHFTFHDDRSPRILPKDVKPVVDKRVVEIPVENSQADLPMPTKGGRKKKKPAKKFHMPDNVVTGFVKASRVRGDGSDIEVDDDVETVTTSRLAAKPSARKKATKTKAPTPPPPEPEPVPLPFITDVLLNKIQERELARKYQYVTTTDGGAAVVRAPMPETNLDGFRHPGPTALVGHSRYTVSIAATLDRMHDVDGVTLERWREALHDSDLEADPQLEPASPPLAIPAPASDSDSDSDLPDLPVAAPRRRARQQQQPRADPPQRKPPAQRGRPKRGPATRTSSAMEAASSSPPPTPREFAMPSQAVTLGSDDTSGDEVAEDPEAWCADSDLASFVARSDEPIQWASSSAGVLTGVDGMWSSQAEEMEDMEEEREKGRKRRRMVVESDSDE